jgi:hypothetical protein
LTHVAELKNIYIQPEVRKREAHARLLEHVSPNGHHSYI